MPGEFFEIDLNRRGKEYIQDIAETGTLTGLAVRDFDDVGVLVNDSFGNQKTGGEFGVMAGGAHGHGNAASAQANFQGFLPGKLVRGSFWIGSG